MTAESARARLRVMVVDDHPLVRNALRQALDTPDLEVVAEAASAEEALELAPNIRPDVLLVDIELPGVDGVALVRELAPRLPETRIVMLTASRDDRHLLDAMRFGAVGYLTKDLSVQGLVRAVRAAWDGELAMSRMGSRTPRPPPDRDVAAGRGPDRGETVLATLYPSRARGAPPACRGAHRPRDRPGADALAAHHRVAREQHPPQARDEEPGGAARRYRRQERSGVESANLG